MFFATQLRKFTQTPLWRIAHWYAGKKHRHRYAREKRYHPSHQANQYARNKMSARIHFKTNRWNYKQAYRDM